MKIPKDATNYAKCSIGPHAAICERLIDMGSHEETFGGKTKTLRKVRIEFAIVDEFDDDGNPFVVGGEYTRSLNEKANLRKMLQTWRGAAFTEPELDDFDLDVILGKPALLQVSHSESGYPRIDSVGTLPKVMRETIPTEPRLTLSFSLHPEEFDPALLERLPQWIQAKILSSPEYRALVATADTSACGDTFEEDIPF